MIQYFIVISVQIISYIEMSMSEFTVLEKLGQGAYSSVYKVERKADQQIYALKKVKMNNLSDKQQQNALNEVRILASVHCTYVVAYKHAFIEGNSLCIVMDYCNDGDLYQKIVAHQKADTKFDENQIWKILIQLLIGIQKLHQLNILHRDLKSANVFLCKDGTVKLGDMNVSKIAKNGLLYTQTGTPYYASPQVWKDKPYDSKSDIWSLGCVIYQISTLKPPFRAEDMDGLFKKVIKGSYPKLGDNFSKLLSSTIKSMLQVNPLNRPSASQILKSLSSKVSQYGFDNQQLEVNNELLQTIRVDKKLHYLTDRLPKSNYNNGYQYEKSTTTNKISTNSGIKSSKNGLSLNYQNLKNINLPKLDRIVLKGVDKSPSNMNLSEKKTSDIGENMLKIEGRNNQYRMEAPKYQRHQYESYEGNQPQKVVERDIKAELRKIYNLRPSPKKITKINKIQLPKIN